MSKLYQTTLPSPNLAAVFPKVFNTRSIQGKDFYFFRDHNEFGRKIAKLQLKSK